MTKSASLPAISPIIGRLPLSRSPPAAEHQNQMSAAEFANRAQDVLQRIRRVAVIQNHAVRRAGIEHLHTARHGDHGFQTLADVLQRYAQDQRTRCCRQRIVDVEHARQQQVNALGMQVAQVQRKGYAAFRDFDIAREQIRLAADAIRQQRAGNALADGLSRLLIDIHGGIAHHVIGKEHPFGGKVVLHGAEEIQVILRQVGISRRLEHHAHQLAQIQRVGGHLHAHDLDARIGHDAQNFKHLDGVRRGQVAGQLGLPGDAAVVPMMPQRIPAASMTLRSR